MRWNRLRACSLLCGLLSLSVSCNIPSAEDFLPAPPAEPPSADAEARPPVAIGFAVTSVEPPAGLPKGQLLVTIRGGGFSPDARVFFGARESSDVTVTSASVIYAVTPPHPPGPVAVRIANPDGTEARLNDGFLYRSPVEIWEIVPTLGPATGGIPVEVRGVGFSGARALLIGGRAVIDLHVLDDGTLVGVLPPGEVGQRDVIVASAAGSGRLARAFRFYAPPRITGLSPLWSPTSGGGALSIVGEGLVAGTRIAIGDVLAEPLAGADRAVNCSFGHRIGCSVTVCNWTDRRFIDIGNVDGEGLAAGAGI